MYDVLMDIDIDNPYICYKITNTVNGKGYIGQTHRKLDKRWKQHLRDAFGKQGKNVFALHLALRKYGAEAFVVNEVARANTLENILSVERQMIVEHNTFSSAGHGYNQTKGGEGVPGYILTEEARARMSKAHLGQKRGPHSTETKRKMSETKKRLGHGPSLYCNQRRKETGTGKPVPFSVREKIRQTLKGRPRPPEVIAKILATKRQKKETQSG